MHTVLNTLYVLTPNAYAHQDDDSIRIDVQREKLLQMSYRGQVRIR